MYTFHFMLRRYKSFRKNLPPQTTKRDRSLHPHQWFNLGLTRCQLVLVRSAVCYLKHAVSKQRNGVSQHYHTVLDHKSF